MSGSGETPLLTSHGEPPAVSGRGPAPAPRAGGRPVLLAALGAISISCSGILMRLAAVGDVPTTLYRCVIALPVLGALAVAERRRHGPQPLSSRILAAGAGLFLGVDLVLWYHAIADVGAGIATVLGNLQVLFVALIAWLVLRERPHRMFLLMLPVIMAGVVLASGVIGHAATGGDPAGGIGYGLTTSLAYAAFILLLRRASTGQPHIAGQLFDATAGAAGAAALIGLASGGIALHLPWPSLGWLALLALLSQTIGWLLITSSLPRLPASLSSLLLLLQPAAALVLAGIVLGEHPTLVQLAGAVLICGGVAVVSRSASGNRQGGKLVAQDMGSEHRITITPAQAHVEVTLGGEVLASSDKAVLLEETGHPERYYIPRSDVRTELLQPSTTTSTCPFKGQASYWSAEAGGTVLEDLVWSYETPIPAAKEIAGLLCFYTERHPGRVEQTVTRR